MNPIAVLKFGSSVLQKDEDLPKAVEEIYRYRRLGYDVIAIVSAIGSTTDDLSERCDRYLPHADPLLIARLLASGEYQSTQLLALELHSRGIRSAVLDVQEANLRATGPILNAEPIRIDRELVLGKTRSEGVLLLPGFSAWHESESLALLGRGGSDLSAVFVAQQVGAQYCRLLKDTAGIYQWDPAKAGPSPLPYARLAWGDACRLSGQVLQFKAVDYAQQHELTFDVSCVGASSSTRVGPFDSELDSQVSRMRPKLKLALLGHGVVGKALYQRLQSHQDKFEVVGVLVRNPAAHPEVPSELLTTEAEKLIEDCDVVVELLGGLEPARSLCMKALALGRSVVTANKLMLADSLDDLESNASAHHGKLRFSASVGGCLPVLESFPRERAGNVKSISAIINGSSNFVIDCMTRGEEQLSAIQKARELGLAEAEWQRDLDGSDSLDKIRLLARSLSGSWPRVMECSGIVGASCKDFVEAKADHKRLRLIANLSRNQEQEFEVSVKLESFNQDSFLGACPGAENRLQVNWSSGESISKLAGEGAGAKPTSESLLADLLDIYRAVHSASQSSSLGVNCEMNHPKQQAKTLTR